MKILLIGNFAPPYEEENLHNLALLDQFQHEGFQCKAINISENPSVEKGITDINNYLDFCIKFVRYSLASNAVHFLTKGYTRPGLMKLVTTVVLGRLIFKKVFITLHSELFSLFGQLRSKMGGQQLLKISFSKANKVICCDRHTYDVASIHYKNKDKFEIMPTFFPINEELKENEAVVFKKLQDRKKIIFFSNLRYPSLLFEILYVLLTKYSVKDIGVIIAFSEKFSSKLIHAVEDVSRDLTDHLVFIDSADTGLISSAYAKSDIVLRNLSCDGKPLFDDIAFCIRKPVPSGNYINFPLSLCLIKEGAIADLCAYILNLIVIEHNVPLSDAKEDILVRMRDIYRKD
ncbi:MAG: hypothetical protein C4538_10700 [Nitrospiraceae bacterium]|nr:MAG: hypothetical protein C4538_10700 [Nitrospiraceae bacterium]